jgi:hypothetical protein
MFRICGSEVRPGPSPAGRHHYAGRLSAQDWQHVRWLGAVRVVRIDLRVPDHPVLADHEAARHRQRPARITVEDRQLILEALVQVDRKAGNATRRPNAAAVSLPGSERIGKPSPLSRIDLRLTGFCGEIARSCLPALISTLKASRLACKGIAFLRTLALAVECAR